MIACDFRGRLGALDEIADEFLVSTRAAPGASVAVARRSAAGSWLVATGAAGTLAPWSRAPVTTATPFDLASVTKPFTAVTLAAVAERAGLPLATPLGAVLEPARRTQLGEMPLELLLAHRAGLAAHLPLFEPLLARRAVAPGELLARALAGLRVECAFPLPAGGFSPVYSDLGYLLAGAALEQIAGASVDSLVEQTLAAPLRLAVGSARQWLARDATFMVRVAPTEHVAWRGGVIRGVVHDENAWAAAGHGAAGHAGLFGTAEAVVRFGAAVLHAAASRAEGGIGAATVEPLLRERPGGSLRAGFDGKSAAQSAAGQVCGPRTFGHLGFTGTSLWCDPDAGTAVAVLTNRVCPTRDHLAIRDARPIVHDALFTLARDLG